MRPNSCFASKNFIFLLLCSFLFFFAVSTPRVLEASLFNPLLAQDHPGFEAFLEGKAYFEAEKWEEAIDCFKRVIQESYKPVFYCRNFIGNEGYAYACYYFLSYPEFEPENESEEGSIGFSIDDDEDDYDYFLGGTDAVEEETYYSLYRHSRFYLGLISLYQGKIKTAHFHFMRAIGFQGKEKEIGPLYFRCINCLNPAWIIQASLTSLALGDVNLAAQLSKFALKTNHFIDEYIDRDGKLDFYWWWGWDSRSSEFLEKYWRDLFKSKMNRKWVRIQEILIHNVKSLVAQAQGDLKQAIESISRAIDYKDYLDENPEHALLHSNRGVFYLEIQDYANALADFTKAIELDPFHAQNYANRGFLYLILKEYGHAIEDYNKALELDPSCLDCYRQRALCHLCQHSLERASSDLLLVESIENQKRYEYNETGIDFFGKGQFQQSIHSFDHLIQANPTESIGYQNRGAAYYQLGSIDLAINDFDHALQLAPQKGELYAMRGAAYLSVANFEEAQTDLLAAMRLNPEQTAVYKNFAALYYAMDHLDEALDYCLEVLSSDPSTTDPELFRDLAIIYFVQENYAEALTYCNKLTALGETTTTIYLIQGLCLFENHQFEEAVRSYDFAIQSDPSLSHAYFNRGQAYYCLLNLEKAQADFNHAIELDPANPAFYKSRGLVLLNLQREEEAYQDFFTAIKLANAEESENQGNSPSPLSLGFLELRSQPSHMRFARARPFLNELSGSSYCSTFFNSPVSLSGLFIDYSKLLGPHAFHQGLIVGMAEGGIEGLKELGPFLAQLLFHPVDTAQEFYEALKLLMVYIAKEEWDKVCECLAPELRELYLTWNEIEDYQKGQLAGRFIGRNGIGFLVGAGVMKSSTVLKKAYLSTKTKMLSGLRKSLPALPPALPRPPVFPISIYAKDSWALACEGGVIMGEKYGTEHVFARMVPKPNIEMQNKLQKHAIDKVKQSGVPVKTWEDVEKWTKTTKERSKFGVDPREIPPMVVEAEIANPASAGIEVVLSEEGRVISALPVKELEATKSLISKISVRNLNTQIHIMQPKHAWEKLIELTGNVEEDCKNVIKLLEDNSIHLEKYRKNTTIRPEFIRYDHKMEINGLEVKAIFNKNPETGEISLSNAWVVTK